MSSDESQPFLGSQAFVKETETYVAFSSKADAILASLQLFHNVPCRYMDLVFSMVTHPDFDATQLTLCKSADVIDIMEESRMKDRMAVVHKRSLGDNGHGRMEQAEFFPESILDEVLDIIHAERMDEIRSRFKESMRAETMRLLTRVEGDDTLKAMSLVHRSWTFPSQKTLGRVLYLGKPAGNLDILLPQVQKSIFGPWTSVVAVQLYYNICKAKYGGYYFSDKPREEYCQWYENLHRILVGFTNLKRVFVQSYATSFSEWSSLTMGELVRRNTHLEEVTVQSERYSGPFILDSLMENFRGLAYLKTLSIEGATLLRHGKGKAIQGTGLGNLKNLTLVRSSTSLFESAEIDLDTLAYLCTLPCLETLRYNGDTASRSHGSFKTEISRVSIPTQCTVAFTQLRSLHIIDNITAERWLEWIGPYCSSLETMTLDTELTLSTKTLPLIPTTIRNLDLRVLLTSWVPVRAVELADRIKRILEIISSGCFSELKSFSLFFSGLETLESDESQKQELQTVVRQLKEFEESMRNHCRSVGVECFIHF